LPRVATTGAIAAGIDVNVEQVTVAKNLRETRARARASASPVSPAN